MASLSS